MTFHRGTFFGSSLQSFSTSIGWGVGQPSQLVVRLADDPDNGDSFNATDADVLKPAHFSLGNFEFSGLLQKAHRTRDLNGNPVYEVVLTDPREILDGCQIIIGGYSGSVGSVSNLLNAYGYWEGQNFGGSRSNEGGMPWYLIKAAVQTMTAGAAGQYGGPLNYRGTSYRVDLSRLPNVPWYYRMGGVSIGLLEAVSQICEDSGYDFFVELVGNTIRVRTVSRIAQPPLGTIAALATSGYGSTLVRSDDGVEGRNEVTSAFLVGGEVTVLHPTDGLRQFWGYDFNGNVILDEDVTLTLKDEVLDPQGNVSEPAIEVDTKEMRLNAAPVSDILGRVTYKCTEFEMRLAKSNYDSWATYVHHHRPDIKNVVFSAFINAGAQFSVPAKPDFVNDEEDLALHSAEQAIAGDGWGKSLRLYEFVRGYADEFLGKKFLAPVPLVLQKEDPETLQVTTSYEVAPAGYVDDGTDPLNLSPLYHDLFQSQDGRFEAFCLFEDVSGMDLTTVPPQGSQVQGQSLYLRCRVEPHILFTPNPHVVITLPSPLTEESLDTIGGVEPVAGVFQKKEEDTKRVLEENYLPTRVAPAARVPDYVAIPLKSNVLTYGPWFAQGAKGKVRFDYDPGLTPWTYGGIGPMNQAGNARVLSAVTNQQVSEAGSVEQAGAPSISLGDSLQRGGPIVTNIDVQYGLRGVTTTYRYQTFTNRFGVFGKQNVERMRRLALTGQALKRAMRGAIRERMYRQEVLGSAKAAKAFLESSPKNIKKENCPPEVLISHTQFGEDGTERTWVQAATYEEAVHLSNPQRDWEKTAVMSLDGLLRPFSTFRTNDPEPSGLPSYSSPPISSSDVPCLASLDPWKELNDVEVWAWGSDYQGLHGRRHQGDYSNARVMALKAPLVLSGWGLGWGSGYAPDNGSGAWPSDIATKPSLWKVGPLDALWDSARGLWTVHDNLKGHIKETIAASGTGLMRVQTKGGEEWDLPITNFFDAELGSGLPAIATYICTDHEWVISALGCG